MKKQMAQLKKLDGDSTEPSMIQMNGAKNKNDDPKSKVNSKDSSEKPKP